MKPPAFQYLRPKSLAEAIDILASAGEDAKLLAGGQSLVPMLNFRLLKPTALVDINRVSELDFIHEGEAGLRIGALTRHRITQTSPIIAKRFPVLTEAMQHVAHLAIRNRGTIGGSVSHADPAAELPLLMTLLNARIRLASRSGTRELSPSEFFLGALTTALEEGEILTEVELPYLPDNTFWGFEEFAQRSGDFAIVAAAVTLTINSGNCEECRVAVLGGETPIRIPDAERMLVGPSPSAEVVTAAAQLASEAAAWNADLHASSEFRKQLVRTLVARALKSALDRHRLVH
jgi:CO/xanthine dehydrogenase FAD-binding subunit